MKSLISYIRKQKYIYIGDLIVTVVISFWTIFISYVGGGLITSKIPNLPPMTEVPPHQLSTAYTVYITLIRLFIFYWLPILLFIIIMKILVGILRRKEPIKVICLHHMLRFLAQLVGLVIVIVIIYFFEMKYTCIGITCAP